jgi:threonine aldolase
MAALVEANEGHAMPYGADRWTAEAVARVRDLFEAPEAAVLLVPTGTAANALALASLAKPWDAIFCTAQAHAQEDECNAPEFFTGGAKLVAVPAPEAKLTPDALRAAMAAWGGSVHSRSAGRSRSRASPSAARSTRSRRSRPLRPSRRSSAPSSTSTVPASPTPARRSAARRPT